MNNVADYIGEDYKEWYCQDCIFISSPTGSGKSYFILHTLLPFFREKGKSILYLVNRRILKEQMQEEIRNLNYEYEKSIHVETYQSIETRICNTENVEKDDYNGFGSVEKLTKCDCVVCDECHYFLTDANYNTNTALSFRFVQENFLRKIRIFISSTMDDVKSYIMQDNVKRLFGCTFYYTLSPSPKYGEAETSDYIYEYNLERNYEYVKPRILMNVKEIINVINENKGKWLIFVDSIAFGEELEKEINKELENQKEKELKDEINKQRLEAAEDKQEVSNVTESKIVQKLMQMAKNKEKAIMISSDYRQHAEGDNEVKRIKEEQRQSAKILISTSVMDNGISLKDIELRNIILSADTEVEFIQMLGRKRQDGEQLLLYIYKLDREHFVRRKRYVEKLLDIAREYRKELETKIDDDIANKSVCFYSQIDWDKYDKLEEEFIKKQHIILMRDIARNKIKYEYAKTLFNVYRGRLYLNYLAVQNLENMNLYYKKIIERFDSEGENAFVREQLSWIGKDDEADEIIRDFHDSQEERIRHIVIDKMVNQVDTPMKIEAALKFKEYVRQDLLKLLELVENKGEKYYTVYNSMKKKDRPISAGNMKYLNKHCGIPFELEVKNNEYIIMHGEGREGDDNNE